MKKPPQPFKCAQYRVPEGKSTRTKNRQNTARRAAKAHLKKEPARRKPACKRQDTAWTWRKAGRNTALVSEFASLSHLDKEPHRAIDTTEPPGV